MDNPRYRQTWRKTDGDKSSFNSKQESKALEKAPSQEPENKAIQNFRDLKIWQLGKEIVVETYKITRCLPGEELYGLTSQMRRAAISIPCNISEGHSQRSTRDYQRFLKIAAGSCAELETQTEIAVELNYLKSPGCDSLMEKINHETRMLRKLISRLSENSIRHPSSSIQKEESASEPIQY